MLQKSSLCEKAAAIEVSVFWKSSRSKKAVLQKKEVCAAEYCFSEKLTFSKSIFSEKFDTVQK